MTPDEVFKLLNKSRRYANFLTVTLAREAKFITIESANNLYIVICNQDNDISMYPYTLYNLSVLKRAERRMYDGLEGIS